MGVGMEEGWRVISMFFLTSVYLFIFIYLILLSVGIVVI